MRKFIPAVVAGAVALTGGAAYGANEALSSDVTLSVDGDQSQVRTWPATVGDVLAKQGITLSENDTVAPSQSTRVTDGTQITVRYARKVTVVLDGTPTTKWVTATNVDEALGMFGIRGDVKLSTSRGTVIGRDGIQLDATSPRGVTIVADGQTRPVTAYGTVGDALTAAGLTVGALDQLTPAATEPVTDGMTITLVRVEMRDVSKEVPVPFQKQQKEDGSLTKGETKVSQAGVNGVATETWTQEVRDGQVVGETRKSSVVTKEATPEITLVGTKAPATTAPKTTSSSTSTKSSGSTSGSGSSSSGSSGSGTSTGSTGGAPATGNTCVASFYDEGQMTASGEVFNPNAMTAAHKTLPLGTMVKVSNPSTGATVTVRINDRGPYIGGRCLDLSRAAFAAIGSTGSGTMTVNWQVV